MSTDSGRMFEPALFEAFERMLRVRRTPAFSPFAAVPRKRYAEAGARLVR